MCTVVIPKYVSFPVSRILIKSVFLSVNIKTTNPWWGSSAGQEQRLDPIILCHASNCYAIVYLRQCIRSPPYLQLAVRVSSGSRSWKARRVFPSFDSPLFTQGKWSQDWDNLLLYEILAPEYPFWYIYYFLLIYIYPLHKLLSIEQ